MGHSFDPYAQLNAWGLEVYSEKIPENNWEEYFDQFFSRKVSKCIVLNAFLQMSLHLKISYIMHLISRVYI